MSVYYCEYCNCEHDGTYGSGRFCSKRCSRKYANKFVTKEGRKRQIESLNKNRQKSFENRKKEKSLSLKGNKTNKSIFNERRRNNGIPLSTKRLGNIGEVATLKKFVEREIPVYLPFGDNEDADMIIEINGELKKVQVKTSSRNNGEITRFETTHRDEKTHKTSVPYDNIDYFSLYDYIADELYLIKNTGSKHKQIRHISANGKNNNESTYSTDVQIDKVLDELQHNVVIDAEFVEIKSIDNK